MCSFLAEGTRLLKNFFSETKERIENYNKNFDELMQEFRDKAVGDTLVVVHRTWERIGDLGSACSSGTGHTPFLIHMI
jgi:hypothetical protein